MKTQDYLREFATIFFIQRKTILGTTLFAFALGVLLVLFWPKTYKAEGALILKGSQVLQPQQTLSKVNAKVDSIREVDLFSDMEILRSQDVIYGAVQRLKNNPAFDLDLDDPEVQAATANTIQSNLVATLIPRSNVIRAGINWGSPVQAEIILSSIFEEYLQRRQAVFNPEEEEAFFKSQLKSFHSSLEEIESNLLAVAGGSNAEELDNRIRRNVELQGTLRRELNNLETDRIKKVNDVEFLEANLNRKGVNLFTSIDNLELGDFAKKIADLLIEREEKLQVYTANSPEVKRTEENLQSLYGVLLNEVKRHIDRERSVLRGMDQQIASVKRRIAEIEAENQNFYKNFMNAQRLDREREVIEESYRTFATRFREAKIRNETQSDRLFTVGIVERAHASRTAIFPNPRTVLPTSLILGLLLGITLGFFFEFFDHRFKRPEDITNYTGLSYLFSVPTFK